MQAHVRRIKLLPSAPASLSDHSHPIDQAASTPRTYTLSMPYSKHADVQDTDFHTIHNDLKKTLIITGVLIVFEIMLSRMLPT